MKKVSIDRFSLNGVQFRCPDCGRLNMNTKVMFVFLLDDGATIECQNCESEFYTYCEAVDDYRRQKEGLKKGIRALNIKSTNYGDIERNGEVCFYAHNFIEVDGISWGYHRPDDESSVMGSVKSPDPYCDDSYTVTTFYITEQQYSKMLTFINQLSEQQRVYHFMINNCVLFVLSILDHIGVAHTKPLMPFPFFLECVI